MNNRTILTYFIFTCLLFITSSVSFWYGKNSVDPVVTDNNKEVINDFFKNSGTKEKFSKKIKEEIENSTDMSATDSIPFTIKNHFISSKMSNPQSSGTVMSPQSIDKIFESEKQEKIRDTIDIDDTVQVRTKMISNRDKGKPTLNFPNSDNYAIVTMKFGGHSTSTSINVINGEMIKKSTCTASYNTTLKFNRKGTFTIKSPHIVDDSTVEGNEIYITVK